jgi:hypothetical protein
MKTRLVARPSPCWALGSSSQNVFQNPEPAGDLAGVDVGAVAIRLRAGAEAVLGAGAAGVAGVGHSEVAGDVGLDGPSSLMVSPVPGHLVPAKPTGQSAGSHLGTDEES